MPLFTSKDVKERNRLRIAQNFKDYNARIITAEELAKKNRATAEEIAFEQHPELMALAQRYNSNTLTQADADLAKWYYQRHPTSTLSWENLLADTRTKASDQIYGRCKECLIGYEKACRRLEKLNVAQLGLAYEKAQMYLTYPEPVPAGYSYAFASVHGAYYNLAFAYSQGKLGNLNTYTIYVSARVVLDVSSRLGQLMPGQPGYVPRQALTNETWQQRPSGSARGERDFPDASQQKAQAIQLARDLDRQIPAQTASEIHLPLAQRSTGDIAKIVLDLLGIKNPTEIQIARMTCAVETGWHLALGQ